MGWKIYYLEWTGTSSEMFKVLCWRRQTANCQYFSDIQLTKGSLACQSSVQQGSLYCSIMLWFFLYWWDSNPCSMEWARGWYPYYLCIIFSDTNTSLTSVVSIHVAKITCTPFCFLYENNGTSSRYNCLQQQQQQKCVIVSIVCHQGFVDYQKTISRRLQFSWWYALAPPIPP